MEMNIDPYQNTFPGSLPLRIHHRLRSHFSMEQADDLAGVILEALSQNVATKDDIGRVRDDITKNTAELHNEIAKSTAELHAEIKRVEAQINADMTVKLKDMELQMTEKLKALELRMTETMKTLELRMTEKMGDMELRMTEKMGRLIFGSTAFTITVLGALMTLAKFI
jgi:hypothetical protein